MLVVDDFDAAHAIARKIGHPELAEDIQTALEDMALEVCVHESLAHLIALLLPKERANALLKQAEP